MSYLRQAVAPDAWSFHRGQFATSEGQTEKTPVVFQNGESGKTALRTFFVDIVMFCAHPLLRMPLALYKQEVNSGPFPADEPEFVIAGSDPDHLLFIGDVAVAGYGVMEHGMTVASHTARLISHDRRRGCRWATIGATDLTIAKVERMDDLGAADVDVVIIMLGVPDVLLATSSTRWAANLGTVIDHIQDRAAADCRIILAAIPPMGDFQDMPLWVRKLLTLQIHRLNQVTLAATLHRPNTVFVSFPDLRVGKMFAGDLFSWKALHKMWARVIAAATMTALDEAGKTGPRLTHRD